MYDWANSAFALTVMAGLYPVFFHSYYNNQDPSTTFKLGFGNSAAGLIIALLSPILGALADNGIGRKKSLFLFMMLGAFLTGSLYLIPHGAWKTALLCYAVGAIGFSLSNFFYDALLPAVSSPSDYDRVSSAGYAVGYLGCAILFGLNILMINKYQLFGFEDKAAAVKMSFVSAALWWLLFSIPLFIFVKEPSGNKLVKAKLFKISFKQLKIVISEISKHKKILFFLIAYWLYIDGVHTFIRMAVNFGRSMDIPGSTLLITLLMIQVIAFPSSFLFGYIAGKIGTHKTLLSGIIIYISVTITGAFLLKTPGQFMFFAALSAIPIGCLQALSRSYYAKLIPKQDTSKYFGIYSLTGKFAVILGPVTVGTVTLLLQHTGLPAALSERAGFSSIAVFFIAGAVFLNKASKA
jgi:UMF1 family MFS transporter